ncbi:16S rRNA (guanine(527)-N(7))-methyltransferase RsmG [Calothrix sp. NIES-3974]|uniref:16S rRNA (guanine(527)-N(7))-methyltransferase RsmG n=1 Tax=Calothrix sp. NIES-3974 TaxID=2005462 RepID=UPI000B5E159E|nr:glucose-inhibited division protein B [Calothrix sp. NIES-3974]
MQEIDALKIPSLEPMLEIWQQTLNWQPNPQQINRFQQLYTQILQGNRQQNLTRITSSDEFWEKHLWDSLRGISFSFGQPHPPMSPIHEGANIIDIGTGAGFPGIPIAIAHPHAHLTLVDSTQKKITFIQAIATALNLSNIHAIADRAETIGQNPQHRQQYDFATIRAVSSITVCAEYCIPLLKINGIACIYRGKWTREEQIHLENAVAELGAEITQIAEFTTPLSHSQRTCIYLRKVTPTPAKYPRNVGIPSQRPLS